jgi:uncharacterized protein
MMDANSACSTSSTNLPTHSFPPGHRIRVAISTAYSPLVWPAPEPVTLGVYASVSVLELPVRPPRPADAELRSFAAPEEGSREAVKVRRPSTLRRTIERDLSRGDVFYRIFNDGGEFEAAAPIHLEEIDLATGFSVNQEYRIGASDPLSARAEIIGNALLRRKSWTPAVRAAVELRATKNDFIVTAHLTAREGKMEIIARTWEEKIPRDLM